HSFRCAGDQIRLHIRDYQASRSGRHGRHIAAGRHDDAEPDPGNKPEQALADRRAPSDAATQHHRELAVVGRSTLPDGMQARSHTARFKPTATPGDEERGKATPDLAPTAE